MENILLFLGGSSVLAVIVIGLLKKLIKEWVEPRFGDLGINITLLAVSFIISLLAKFVNLLPQHILIAVTEIFVGSIAIYQVIWKAVVQKAILGKLDADEK